MSDQDLMVDLSRRFLNLIDHPSPGCATWHEAVQNIVNQIADVSAKLKRKMKTTKKVNLTLVGLNGNAYSLMGAFSRQARREGWSKEEIDAVLTECQSGDYDHLLQTLIGVCETIGTDEEEE